MAYGLIERIWWWKNERKLWNWPHITECHDRFSVILRIDDFFHTYYATWHEMYYILCIKHLLFPPFALPIGFYSHIFYREGQTYISLNTHERADFDNSKYVDCKIVFTNLHTEQILAKYTQTVAKVQPDPTRVNQSKIGISNAVDILVLSAL